MIAKRVPRRTATSSFVKLTRYITGIKAEGDPVGWPALADYITDARSDGARVEYVRLTNLDSDEVGPAVKEIIATQAMNTRSGADKVYHMVVAFPPGERPTRAQLDDIEDTLCAAIGLGEHQRVSAAHDDTDHFHFHVAINTVHPVTYRNVSPAWDKRTLMRTCVELEQKHGLAITNHGEAPQVGPKRKACDMEAHSGRESLARWVKENAAEDLARAASTATNWRDMHDAAARHGLELRPRGAGLTIGAAGKPEAVKASDVDRRLSFKALTDRLGPFAPREQQATPPEPKQQYRKGPRQSVPGTAALFAQYQAVRATAEAARQAARAKAKNDQDAFTVRLKLWHAERRRVVREGAHLTPQEKRTAYRALGAERRASWQRQREDRAAERLNPGTTVPLPTWQTFLADAAARGDPIATAALRSRQQLRQRFAMDVLTAEDAEKAKHVVYHQLTPHAKRNGDLVYAVKDGGRVTDAAHHVRVDELTTGAAFLALSLASDRFGDRPLKVEGTDEFKAQVAAVAAIEGMAVRFANPMMEAARAQAAAARGAAAPSTPAAPTPPATPQPTPRPALDPIAAFVRDRNAARDKVSTIDYHRAWSEKDAGPAEYGGRRKLADGSEAVLLKKGGETLVKPVTPAQAAKASTWTIGASVTTDRRGRFAGERGRGR